MTGRSTKASRKARAKSALREPGPLEAFLRNAEARAALTVVAELVVIPILRALLAAPPPAPLAPPAPATLPEAPFPWQTVYPGRYPGARPACAASPRRSSLVEPAPPHLNQSESRKDVN